MTQSDRKSPTKAYISPTSFHSTLTSSYAQFIVILRNRAVPAQLTIKILQA